MCKLDHNHHFGQKKLKIDKYWLFVDTFSITKNIHNFANSSKLVKYGLFQFY